jgi:hypothetical protein
LNGIGFHIDRHNWDSRGSFCGGADSVSSDDDENTDTAVDQLPDQLWQKMRITLAGSGKDGLSIDIPKTAPFPLALSHFVKPARKKAKGSYLQKVLQAFDPLKNSSIPFWKCPTRLDRTKFQAKFAQRLRYSTEALLINVESTR